MLEPSTVVLYVSDMTISSSLYQDLLGIKPVKDSPTFHNFILSNGMSIGLKAKHDVLPPVNEHACGNGELAFTLASSREVDERFTAWQKKGVNIPNPPSMVTYGYTFVALDPDGNRLRVVSLGTF